MRQIRTNDPYRVLVVEDDTLVRDLIVDILAEAGFAMSAASCADEALGFFFDQPDIAAEIAVVVTDIDMPGKIDGIGLAARLNETWPQIGVVVTSGAHRAETHAFRPPAAFLAKPFCADRLVDAVRSVINADVARQHRRAC